VRGAVACALVLAASLACRTALAGDPASTFSIGARAAALGGAGGALEEPATAGFLNPAAAALGSGFEVRLGYLFAHPLLEYNGQRIDMRDVHGLSLGLRIPLLDRIVGKSQLRAAFGLGLHVPDRSIARVYLVEPDRPSFVMWEGPVHRIVVVPVLAIAAGSFVSIGAGVTLLADGSGDVSLDLGFEGSQTRTDAEVDLELRLRAAPVVGVTLNPFPWITIAGGYSGELAMDIALDVRADIGAPGLAGTTEVAIRGTNDYTPPSAWAAVGIHPAGWIDVHLQAAYVMWHRANPFHARIRMLVDLGADPAVLGGIVPARELDDRWVLSAGIEGRIPLPLGCALALRAGYQYRPTPIPDQTGWTSYVDSDVHLASTGLGFSTPVARAARLRLDWAFQVQRLVPRSVAKDPDVFVVTGFRSEGWVLASMLEIGIAF